MSAEADRRLQEDLRFLESVNVWQLVNLHSPSNPSQSLYSHPSAYPDRLDVISPSMTQLGTYSPQNYYTNNSSTPSYTDSPHKYHNGNFHSNPTTAPPIAPGIGQSLPYPDLILHTTTQTMAPEVVPRQRVTQNNISVDINGEAFKDKHNDEEPLENLQTLKYNNNIVESRDFSPVIQNPLPLKDTPRLKHLSLLPKESQDYDEVCPVNNRDRDRLTPSSSEDKKCVSFTTDTVFVERDMDTPFWRAFTERRRLRRIHRQKKQLNQQIANVTSYQPSLLEIVKSAFSGSKSSDKDSNGNCTSKSHHHHHSKHKSKKGEVLVYDNSSQIPEKYTAQYVYNAPPSRSHKIFQMIAGKCRSSSPAGSAISTTSTSTSSNC